MQTKTAFLIAAPHSNSGKTLITLGLIKVLCRKGFSVQPFKCGPDYIDPMHHRKVAGVPSYNLDLWMASPQHIKSIFTEKMQKVEIGVAEGVMGLFDGATKDKGSSADVARLLNLPVILAVDASSTAYSIAPLLYGFKNFDKSIQLAGVIFNKTGSERHFQFLKEAANDVGVNVLGHIPRDNRLKIESRHLGLHLPGENNKEELVEIAADLIDKNIDLEKLIQVCQIEVSDNQKNQPKFAPKKPIVTAMAFDEAFNFSYQANIDALKALGEVRFFSPLTDTQVPEADWIWLPGGYPELFTEKLASNESMKKDLSDKIEAGIPVLAECGGMMYLGKGIVSKEGEHFEMAGIFDFSTSFENMKLHLGYRTIKLGDLILKGHEFHFSNLLNGQNHLKYQATAASGKPVNMPVFRYKNCMASYMHNYLGEAESLFQLFNFLKENNE